MALIFGIVVAHELLFASGEFRPVAVFYGSGIAGTLLLLLHLHVKLLLIDGIAVLTTDQLREVERETVGIEEAECLYTVELGLALSLQLFHGLIQHGDTLIQRAQESLFLFLDHLHDQLLLGLQFRECITHLMDERRHQLMEERLLLPEERIGITHSTAQDSADHIARLRIRRQLSIRNREAHSPQMIRAHTHRHVNTLLARTTGTTSLFFLLESKVLQPRQLLLSLDNRLEHVGIIIRVLTLQHAHQTLEAHTRVNHVHREFLK